MFHLTLRTLIIFALFLCVSCQRDGEYIKLLRQLKRQTHDYGTSSTGTDIKLLDRAEINDNFVRPMLRSNSFVSNNGETKKRRFLKGEHEGRVREIIAFVKTHPLTAKYFYDEVQRIKRQNVVKDDLRKMVTLLERMPDLKKEILDLFQKYLKNVVKVTDFWARPPNDLVINPFGGAFIDSTYT
ncbi:unnamed protein product, partial [Iphiclides podalirius]